jgi:hypothetical protein
MSCRFHYRDYCDECTECRAPICGNCTKELESKLYCQKCFDQKKYEESMNLVELERYRIYNFLSDSLTLYPTCHDKVLKAYSHKFPFPDRK